MRAIVGSSGLQRLLRIAAARRVPADQVEDVVQEALLAAWRKCPAELWKDETAIQRWLESVTRRLAINWVRDRRRRLGQALNESHLALRDRRGHEAAQLLQQEEECALLRAWVKEWREQEPDNYLLLTGHYFEGQSVEALATALGILPNAASRRLTRLRARLGARLLRHREDSGAP